MKRSHVSMKYRRDEKRGKMSMKKLGSMKNEDIEKR